MDVDGPEEPKGPATGTADGSPAHQVPGQPGPARTVGPKPPSAPDAPPGTGGPTVDPRAAVPQQRHRLVPPPPAPAPGGPTAGDPPPSPGLPPPDAELIGRMRAGDDSAYEALYRRHAPAVHRYARTCCRDRHTADDLTAEVFARMLQAVRRGAGPEHAVRAYLLTTVRRVAAHWTNSAKREQLIDDFALFAAQAARGSELADDTAVDEGADVRAMHEAERSMAMRAFRSLPERWQAVLWHTEVENESPSEVATLFGLDANGTRVLASRAREGLKQAYLQAHVSTALTTSEECARYADRLGAFARGGLRTRAERGLRKHLEECAKCRIAAGQIKEVAGGIPAVVPVAVIGWFGAAGYGKVAASGGAAGSGSAGGSGGGGLSEAVGGPVKAGIGAALALAAAVAVAFALVGNEGARPEEPRAKPPVSQPGEAPPVARPQPVPPTPAPAAPAAPPPGAGPAPEAPAPAAEPDPVAEAEAPPATAPAEPPAAEPDPEPTPEPEAAPSASAEPEPEPSPSAPSPSPSPKPTPTPRPEPTSSSAPSTPPPAPEVYEWSELRYAGLGDGTGPEMRPGESSWVWQRRGPSIAGQPYPHGVTVHGQSSVTIDLNRACRSYDAVVGVDDLALGGGKVRFAVYADGERMWHSPMVKAGRPGVAVHVDLTGRSTIRLVVEPHTVFDTLVLSTWAQSRFTC
ncbi:sigma-70 family RNA polymerase sigma factor [Streptomyces sp. LE64]|uniref:sigma-70 family RNA polymerase sigma factor n=1 Tax=Streptomyces sp. LE64 TaxID=3448653 RepID=UPI00404235FF